jgi:hypothetical protein
MMRDCSLFPLTKIASVPDGAHPQQISDKKILKKLPCPPSLGVVLRLVIFVNTIIFMGNYSFFSADAPGGYGI